MSPIFEISFLGLLAADAVAADTARLPAIAMPLPGESGDGIAEPEPSDQRPRPVLAVLAAQDGTAPAPSPEPDETGPAMPMIERVEILGAGDAITPQAFEPAIASALNTPAGTEELARLVSELAAIARAEGYAMARVRVPRQTIRDGLLQVEVDPGRIDEVVIEGSDNAALAAMLRPLTGGYASAAAIRHRIKLAGELPAVRIKRTRFRRDGDRTLLVVEAESAPQRQRLVVDNHGTRSFGPWRARIDLRTAALLTGSDQARLQLRTNPADPEEFVNGYARYELGLGASGVRLGVAGSYGDSQPETRNLPFPLNGEAIYAASDLRVPLLRGPGSAFDLIGSAAWLSIRQDLLDLPVTEDVTFVLAVELSGSLPLAGGRLYLGGGVERGIAALGATRIDNPAGSRFDADAEFTKANAWADWYLPIRGGLTARFAMRGQLSADPLPASQEINVGGPFWGRGFDFSERDGEDGLLGLSEIGYEFDGLNGAVKRLQLFGFVDGGTVSQHNGTRGDGTIVSAGGGVRTRLGPMSVELEGAAPINADRRASGDRSPQVNVEVGLQF